MQNFEEGRHFSFFMFCIFDTSINVFDVFLVSVFVRLLYLHLPFQILIDGL